MAELQFLDTPPPEDQVQFLDTPAPEKGMFGQTIDKPGPSGLGWDIAAGKQMNIPDPRSTAEFERSAEYPNAKMTDPSIQDAMAVQGAAGLGKLGVGLAGKAAGTVLNDVIPAASKIPTLGAVIPNTENLVPTVGRIADNQTLKSLGGTMGQIKAMGEGRGGREALDKAAKYARDKGLADVFSTDIGRDKQLADLLKSTGKTVGDFRAEAGAAQPGILDTVEADVMKKYGPKALKSGEAPAVKKTMDFVRNEAGQAPELPVMDPKTMTGKPQAIFAYNDPPLNAGGSPVSKYQVFGNPNDPAMKAIGHGTQKTLAELKEAGIPVIGRTARSVGKWEPLDLAPAPTHAGLAKSATDINEFAAGNRIYQPINAETDVANALSRENNAGIVQSLGSNKGKQYLGSLEEQSQLHPLEHLQKRGELREVAGRGGGFSSIPQKIADAMGYRITAKTAGAIHDLLVGEGLPKAVQQAVPSASKMVPSALQDFLEKKYGHK